MAYAVKYRITVATQADVVMRLDMLENGYEGSIIEYIGTGLQLQYIPSSDDSFETIYASQLSVSINVTPDLANMPDLTTLNDRKYLCKLYAGSTLEWMGWALSDEVQMSFNSGIRELSFNAICGLGMLNSIYFVDNTATNTRKTILYLLYTSLNRIAFDTNPNLFTSVSMYSAGMTDRDADAAAEPLIQSYTQLLSIQSNSEYITCLQVLKDILKSFGCRIYQARGKWHIMQLNQQALPAPYFTEYDATGTVVSSGTFTDLKNIPDDLQFIHGSQIKIFKKGYNSIVSNNDIKYPENYIFNADLKLNDGTDATGWSRTTGGTGTVVLSVDVTGKNNVWIMNHPTTGAFALVEITSLPVMRKNDEISITWQFLDGVFANVDGHACKVPIIINDGVTSWYYNSLIEWAPVVGPITDYYIALDENIVTNSNYQYNFTLKPAPISGNMSFGLRLDDDTATSMTVGAFKITNKSPFKSVNITSKISDTDEYTKEVQFPFGLTSNESGKFGYIGFLSDIDGEVLQTWYMMERKGVENYRSLAELMVKNYVIQYRKNIINIDGSVKSMGAEIARTSARTRMTADDTDPAQISVTGKYYLMGNTSINYPSDEIQSTFLEVTDTNQTAVITTLYENDQDSGVTTTGRRLGNTSTSTRITACALSYGSQRLYFVDDTYNIGDITYYNNTLTVRFNGATRWWLVEILELASSRAMLIDGTGVILDIQTC